MHKTAAIPVSKPQSASHFWFNVGAGLIGLAWLIWRQSVDPTEAQANGLSAGLIIAVLVGSHELFRLKAHRNASTGLDWDAPFTPSLERVVWKLLGLLATIALLASIYWLLPEYHGSFYNPFWDALKKYGLPMLAASPIYFWVVDGRMKTPEDGYWHMGRALLRPSTPEGLRLIKAHLGGWAVKGFFLPLMVTYVGQEVNGVWNAVTPILNASGEAGGLWPAIQQQKLGFYPYELLYHFTFTVDLLFCVVGYTMTLKIFDAHIRSTEPTAFGWMVALMCYQPFFSLIENQYLRYEDGIFWGGWLQNFPVVKFFWAASILLLLVIYCLATVAFGIRFSNLTHRGVITHGPYRYSKHPAYLSKNLSWWLVSVPFIALAPAAALTNCVHLAFINLVYFWRARTEEAHLSRDPTYVAYAEWMNEHGLLARLGRWLPMLRYKSPETLAAAAKGG